MTRCDSTAYERRQAREGCRCYRCEAAPGYNCVTAAGTRTRTHVLRVYEWRRELDRRARERAEAGQK